jgi:hypothetical protein
MSKVSQLRIYTIQEGKMDDWIAEWRDGVVPLRRKHGFRVDGAWVARVENTFVWILSYDGAGDWKTEDAAYYSSADRKSLNPDPARLIAHVKQSMLTPVAAK